MTPPVTSWNQGLKVRAPYLSSARYWRYRKRHARGPTMNAPRLSLLLLLCSWAASCGGEGFTAAPGGQPDASAGGTDAGAEASAGQGGSAGTSPSGGSAGSSAAGGTGGVAGTGGGGTGGVAGTGGAAGTAGTGGTGAMGGTGGVGGAGGVGGTGGVGGSAGSAGTGGTAQGCPAGEHCLLNVPVGWTPVATGTVQPVECKQPAHPLLSQAALDNANDYVCPCTCGAPSSGTCSAKLAFHTDASCSASMSSPCGVATTCTQCVANPSNATHYKFTTVTTGSCATPTPPTPPPPAISGYECSAVASGSPATCDNGGICVQNFSAPAKVCVMRAGVQSCPSGFTNAGSYYESITDTRTCNGTCACVIGCKCSGNSCHLKIHADQTCGSPATLLADGACTVKPAGFGANLSADLAVQPLPACQPTVSSTLKGQVEGSDGVTICCQP